MYGNGEIRSRFTPTSQAANNHVADFIQAVDGNRDVPPGLDRGGGRMVQLDIQAVDPMLNQAVPGERPMRHGIFRGVVGSLMSIAVNITAPMVVRSVPLLQNHATGEALALAMAFRLGRQISDTADHFLGSVIQDQQTRTRVANAVGGIAGMATFFVARQASPITIANSALTAILNRAITGALSHFGDTFRDTIGLRQASDALASEYVVRVFLGTLASGIIESLQLPRDSLVRPITSGAVALFATLLGRAGENSLRTEGLVATAPRPGALSSIVSALIGPFIDGNLSPATSIMIGRMMDTYSPEANGQDSDVWYAALATALNELSTMADGLLDRVLASSNRPNPDLRQ